MAIYKDMEGLSSLNFKLIRTRSNADRFQICNSEKHVPSGLKQGLLFFSAHYQEQIIQGKYKTQRRQNNGEPKSH